MAELTIAQLAAIDAVDVADQAALWDASASLTKRATVAQILAGQPQYLAGTWTPTLTIGGATPTGIAYTQQAGQFARIGGWVNLVGRLGLTAKGSSTGAVKIVGLPYAISVAHAPPALSAFSLAAGSPTLTVLQALAVSSEISLYIGALTAAASLMQDSHLSNTSIFYFTLSYWTTAGF